MSLNKGFLRMIDLTTNISAATRSLDGVSGGLAAIMAVGLTIVAFGLFPLVWFFDIDTTYTYTSDFVSILLPTMPARIAGYIGVFTVTASVLPTVIQLLFPRIAARVPSFAFLVFTFIALDAVTDYPRVQHTMAVYADDFLAWGGVGQVLWYAAHIPLLLFSTMLFELIFVLCVVLVGVMIGKIFYNEALLSGGRG
jgi:hypothetical protein